eukprot:jgi/Chlat1/5240/Chrsp33S05083
MAKIKMMQDDGQPGGPAVKPPAGEGPGAKRKWTEGSADDVEPEASRPPKAATVSQPAPRPTQLPPKSCIHEVALPDDYKQAEGLTEEVNGTIHDPKYNGEMAQKYPFELDPFQKASVACLERRESVLVAAHTSAGKTAVAEYAIAMAFRDKQRVIYTSPLKALSNQKYRELGDIFSDVGLMTGDVSISPNATCLVMTTEILRSMLYRGSEVLREVSWVIFDEIHYMMDRERGVVWEESIIFLPPALRMIFLSATISNATEFAEWVCRIHSKPVHVVYTDHRPTPLQHYAFAQGGSGLYLVVDERGRFREDNFKKLLTNFASEQPETAPPQNGGKKTPPPSKNNKKGGGGGPPDVHKIVKMIMDRKFYPVIVFSFSRRECEQYALAMSKLDFNTETERESIEEVFRNAMQCLDEEDRQLPAIETILPILKRGIGVHHSGLLPILKEVIEILFQEGLIKALFATETFAMGLNMPAKTVVFTAVRKWDGEGHRYMSSGEYIQMSGRAGRRGKDDKGISIVMLDDQLDMNTCKNMLMGAPAPLVSTFRLSYYTLLNLMSRAEGQFDAEYVIAHSFHQFQHEKALPQVQQTLQKLEEEAASMAVGSTEEAEEARKLRSEIASLEKDMIKQILRPDRCLHFLRPGRLVKVHDGEAEWDWGVVLNVVRRTRGKAQKNTDTPLPKDLPAGAYLVDILLHCRSSDGVTGSVKPKPALPEERGYMQAVPVPLPLITAISSLRVYVPPDLRPAEARQSVLLSLQELKKRFPDGIPRLDPIEDMGIDDAEFVRTVRRIEKLEVALLQNPTFKESTQGGSQGERAKALEKKAALEAQAAEMKAKMQESQLSLFRGELRSRSRVLKRLGHINEDGVVQIKGRAACEVDTTDELLITELMFDGVFNDLDAHQATALVSCLIPVDKSNEQVHLTNALTEPLKALHDTARRIGEVQKECGIEMNVEEYVESFRPYLMDVVYHWSKGAKFAEVIAMTDIFEGSIIRAVRRMAELMSQLKAAARVLGDERLAEKFDKGDASIRRAIMFANSLYI